MKLSAMCETDFHYQDKVPPIDYVVRIASNMQVCKSLSNTINYPSFFSFNMLIKFGYQYSSYTDTLSFLFYRITLQKIGWSDHLYFRSSTQKLLKQYSMNSLRIMLGKFSDSAHGFVLACKILNSHRTFAYNILLVITNIVNACSHISVKLQFHRIMIEVLSVSRLKNYSLPAILKILKNCRCLMF